MLAPDNAAGLTYEAPTQVAWWSFREAPANLRALFPECGERGWVVHVPAEERLAVEPYLLRWVPVYPVTLMELPDRSVVYCGATEDAFRLIAERGRPADGSSPMRVERRRDLRMLLEYPCRYETSGESRLSGIGHTISWSPDGISFTTESSLSKDIEVTLHVAWPVRLANDASVQLRVHGSLVHAEETNAAIRLEDFSFVIVEEDSAGA